MLATAIKAKLPLIAVRTNDPMNVGAMLEHYTALKILLNPGIKGGVPVITPNSVVVLESYESLVMCSMRRGPQVPW
jgi:hypothetical protein